MTTEQQLRDRLRKIAALFEGATTIGERNAAAIDRTKRAIEAAGKVEQAVEYHFLISRITGGDVFSRHYAGGTGWSRIVTIASAILQSWSESPNPSSTVRYGRSTWNLVRRLVSTWMRLPNESSARKSTVIPGKPPNAKSPMDLKKRRFKACEHEKTWSWFWSAEGAWRAIRNLRDWL